MDSSTLDTFLKLLRSGLFGTRLEAADMPADIDWHAVLDMAKRQTVTGLIADAVSRLPEECKPDKATLNKLMVTSLNILKSHMLLDTTVAQLVQLLESEGMHPVLLKGQGIARCYQTPTLRQCGDIDMYVGEADYQRACKLCVRQLHDKAEAPEESSKHVELRHGPVSIEIHRCAAVMFVPWRNPRFQKWETTHLDDKGKCDYVNIAGSKVATPDADFNAIFLLYHIWNHLFYLGVGLRQFCDIAMLFHQKGKEIDREALKRQLKEMHLTKVWQALGSLLVERLGLPADEMPLYTRGKSKKGDTLLELAMMTGNFGQHIEGIFARRRESMIKRKLRSFGTITYIYGKMFKIDPLEAVIHYIYKTFDATIHLFRDNQAKPWKEPEL